MTALHTVLGTLAAELAAWQGFYLFYMRHRFPNTEGETESRVQGSLCRTRTLLTLYITTTTWDNRL